MSSSSFLPPVSQQFRESVSSTASRKTFSNGIAGGSRGNRPRSAGGERVTIISTPREENIASVVLVDDSGSVNASASQLVQRGSSSSSVNTISSSSGQNGGKYTIEFSVYKPPYVPELCRNETSTAAERYYQKKRDQQSRYETVLFERQVAQSGATSLAPETAALLRRRATGAGSIGAGQHQLPPIQRRSGMLDAELTDEIEVELLKNRLATLEKNRSVNEHNLTLVNNPRIERDILREEYYRSAFKTPEQLEAERLEALRKALELDIERLVVEEEGAREDEVEEESLEYQYQLYTLHLRMVSISVHAVIQERARVDNQAKLVEEERYRKLAGTQQMLASCEHEAEFGTERRKGTEREEALARRALYNLFETCLTAFNEEVDKRFEGEAHKLEMEEQDRLDRIRRDQEKEEEDAEKALELRMATIDRKYAALAARRETGM